MKTGSIIGISILIVILIIVLIVYLSFSKERLNNKIFTAARNNDITTVKQLLKKKEGDPPDRPYIFLKNNSLKHIIKRR